MQLISVSCNRRSHCCRGSLEPTVLCYSNMSYITVRHRCKGKGHTNVLNRLSSFECRIFWTWEDSHFLDFHHIQTACPAHHHQHARSDMPHCAALVHVDANGLFSHQITLFTESFLPEFVPQFVPCSVIQSFIHPCWSYFLHCVFFLRGQICTVTAQQFHQCNHSSKSFCSALTN